MKQSYVLRKLQIDRRRKKKDREKKN